MISTTRIQHVCRICTRLVFIALTLIALRVTTARATVVAETITRVPGIILPKGGLAPVCDIQLTSDGVTGTIITKFTFAASGTTPAGSNINMEVLMYDKTASQNARGAFLGKGKVRPGGLVEVDAYQEFYVGLIDVRVLGVYVVTYGKYPEIQTPLSSGRITSPRPLLHSS